jgi:hypothetical protein
VRNKKFPYSQLSKAGTRREPFLEAKERLSSYGLENWEEEEHIKGRRKNK